MPKYINLLFINKLINYIIIIVMSIYIMESTVNLSHNIYNVEKEVQSLENSILKLDEIIQLQNNKLENNNILLKDKIKELEQDNKELKEEIKELKQDKIKNKIFKALSDIINNENLENQISEIYDDLNYFKSSRNNLCHYIRDKDSKDVKNKKIEVTINVLKTISKEIKNEIICEFDNDIIEKIIDYYEQNKLFINSSNISNKELIRINNWWK
jgi:hypothetical protein